MIKYKIKQRTTLKVNNSVEGETIEQKSEELSKTMNQLATPPLIYTERKTGAASLRHSHG